MTKHRQGQVVFAIGLVAIVWIWVVLLPQISRHLDDSLESQQREAMGMDTRAVFYTDHPRHREIYLSIQDRLESKGNIGR